MSETTQKWGVDQHPQRGVKVIEKHAVLPLNAVEWGFLLKGLNTIFYTYQNF